MYPIRQVDLVKRNLVVSEMFSIGYALMKNETTVAMTQDASAQNIDARNNAPSKDEHAHIARLGRKRNHTRYRGRKCWLVLTVRVARAATSVSDPHR
jgi:hypothetical protein